MSEEEEQIENQQQGDEEDEDQEGGDEDQEEDEDEDGQGDQDQDQEGQQDQDQEQDQEGEDQEEDEKEEEEQKPVPSFKPVSQQFAFKNLVAQIASLGNSVDHFINTLPSRGGSVYRSYQPQPMPLTLRSQPPPPPVQKNYTIMKDEDIQVSMQPQIVIQQTLVPKQQPKKQPYRISNESTKFLAQLYQQNKKLKRWQTGQMGQTGAGQTGGGQTGNGWYKSGGKFQRPQHQRGLINLDDRNKEIDQAIEMLRREDNYS